MSIFQQIKEAEITAALLLFGLAIATIVWWWRGR